MIRACIAVLLASAVAAADPSYLHGFYSQGGLYGFAVDSDNNKVFTLHSTSILTLDTLTIESSRPDAGFSAVDITPKPGLVASCTTGGFYFTLGANLTKLRFTDVFEVIFDVPVAATNCTRILPSGDFLYASCTDKIHVWSQATGAEMSTYTPPLSGVHSTIRDITVSSQSLFYMIGTNIRRVQLSPADGSLSSTFTEIDSCTTIPTNPRLVSYNNVVYSSCLTVNSFDDSTSTALAFTYGGVPQGLYVSNGWLWVVMSNSFIHLYDVSDPKNPSYVRKIQVPPGDYTVLGAAAGERVFLSNYNVGVLAYGVEGIVDVWENPEMNRRESFVGENTIQALDSIPLLLSDGTLVAYDAPSDPSFTNPEIGVVENDVPYTLLFSNTSGSCSVFIKTPAEIIPTGILHDCGSHSVNTSMHLGINVHAGMAIIDVGDYEPSIPFLKQNTGVWTGSLYAVDLTTGFTRSSPKFNMTSVGNYILRGCPSVATTHFIASDQNALGEMLVVLSHAQDAFKIFAIGAASISEVSSTPTPFGNSVSSMGTTVYSIGQKGLKMYNVSNPNNVTTSYLPLHGGPKATDTQRIVLCNNGNKRYEDGGYMFITEDINVSNMKMGSVMRYVRTTGNALRLATGSFVASDYYLYHMTQSCTVLSPNNITVTFRYMGVFGTQYIEYYGTVESRYTTTEVSIFWKESRSSLSLPLNFSSSYPDIGTATRFASREPWPGGAFLKIGDMCSGSSLGPGPHGILALAVRKCTSQIYLRIFSNNSHLADVYPTDKGGIIGLSLADDNYVILHRVGSSIMGGEADRIVVEKSVLPFPELVPNWCPVSIDMEFKGIGSGIRESSTCNGHSYCMPRVIADTAVCVDNINFFTEGNFITTRGLSTNKIQISTERASPVVGFGATFVEPLKLYPAYIRSDSTKFGIVNIETGAYEPVRHTLADALTVVQNGEEYIFGCEYDTLIGYRYRPGELTKLFPDGLYQSCWKMMAVDTTLIVFSDNGMMDMYDIADVTIPVPASSQPHESYSFNSYPSPALSQIPDVPGMWGGYIAVGKDATTVKTVAYSQPVLTYYHDALNRSDISPGLVVGEPKLLHFDGDCISLDDLFLFRCDVSVAKVTEVTRYLPQKSTSLPYWIQEQSLNTFQFVAPKEYSGSHLILKVHVSIGIRHSTTVVNDVHVIRIPIEKSLFLVRHNETSPPYTSVTSPAATLKVSILFVAAANSTGRVEFVPETFPGLFCSYPSNSIECMGSSVGVSNMLRKLRYSPQGDIQNWSFFLKLTDDINYDLEEDVPMLYFTENRAPSLIENTTLRTSVRDKFVLSYHLPELFRDPDGDMITVKVNTSLADWLSYDSEKQKLFGTASLLDASKEREYTVVISGSDGHKQTTTILLITIIPNSAPVTVTTVDNLNYTCLSMHACTYPMDFGFFDPDSDTISYRMEGQEYWMEFTQLMFLEVKPDEHVNNGTYTVTLVVSDGHNHTQVDIDIIIVANSAPIQLSPIEDIHLMSGGNLFLNISKHVMDPDGDDLAITDDTEGAVSFMKLNNGVIQGNPEPDDEGSYDLVFLVSDGYEGQLRVRIHMTVDMAFMDVLIKWIEDYGTVTGLLGLLVALVSLRHPIYNVFFRHKYFWSKPPEQCFSDSTYFPQILPRKFLGLLVDTSSVTESLKYPGSITSSAEDVQQIDIASVVVYQLSNKNVPLCRGLFHTISREEVLLHDDFFIKIYGAGIKIDVAEYPAEGPSYSVLFTGKSGYNVQEILLKPHAELKYFSDGAKFTQLAKSSIGMGNDDNWLLESIVDSSPRADTDLVPALAEHKAASFNLSNGNNSTDGDATRTPSVKFNILKPVPDFPLELTQSLTAESSLVQL